MGWRRVSIVSGIVLQPRWSAGVFWKLKRPCLSVMEGWRSERRRVEGRRCGFVTFVSLAAFVCLLLEIFLINAMASCGSPAGGGDLPAHTRPWQSGSFLLFPVHWL